MSQKIVSANDYKDVVTVINKYMEALRAGDVDVLTNIFYKESATYGTVNGELVGGFCNPAIDFVKTYGKSPEIEYHIDILDISPTTAAVRIVMEKDAIGSDCNENLLLIKLDKSWTIIAKVFHQF